MQPTRRCTTPIPSPDPSSHSPRAWTATSLLWQRANSLRGEKRSLRPRMQTPGAEQCSPATSGQER
eukprot:1761934-Lingulodinium_polyedra.AAC.1